MTSAAKTYSGADASLVRRVYVMFRIPLSIFFVILAAGAAGYWIITEGKASLLDCVYMTFITIATIGFSEVIDLQHSPGGRIFTMFIAVAGIMNLAYMTSKLTAFIVDGSINEVLRRRKMQDRIDALKDHYIICGMGRVGTNIAHELIVTGRRFVGIEESREAIEVFNEKYPQQFLLHGDCSDDDWLVRAGIGRAAGVFAVTGDDSKNLFITLTARQLNANVRIVARCHDVRNMEKLRRVGGDAIVSPDFTGGMRMASSMIRPAVVTFLDEMLRSDNRLRVEEVGIPPGFEPKKLGEIVRPSRDYIVLAIRDGKDWHFNPAADFELRPGATLVVMAHPEGRQEIERCVAR
jgi:voltage-gated potassium channel